MSNIASLADFREKRGLPPATFPDERTPLERLIARYLNQDICKERGVKPSAALRLIAGLCAKSIVQWAEQQGRPVDDAARFQFFATGHHGRELLQVRVSRLGPSTGPWQAQTFQMDCETMEAVPLPATPPEAEVFKPLLTLPMSGFYRLR
jgi:hypothetical protein